MSYLSSCCISLHYRRVLACVRVCVSCVCCTLPSFIWKRIHWVLSSSFGHATGYGLDLAFMVLPDLKDSITVVCFCGDLICWLYPLTLSLLSGCLLRSAQLIRGLNLTVPQHMSLNPSSVFRIALWFKPRKRKTPPFSFYFLV